MLRERPAKRFSTTLACVVAFGGILSLACERGVVGDVHDSHAAEAAVRVIARETPEGLPLLLVHAERSQAMATVFEVLAAERPDWRDRILIVFAENRSSGDSRIRRADIRTTLAPPSSSSLVASIRSLYTGAVLGVSSSGEVAHLPAPVGLSRLKRFLSLLDEEASLAEAARRVIRALEEKVESSFSGRCAGSVARGSGGDYAFFWDVCDSCSTGRELEALERRSESGWLQCVAIPADYDDLSRRLEKSPNIVVARVDLAKGDVRELIFLFTVLVHESGSHTWRK